MKIELDPITTAKEIVELVDRIGSGLSEEHEARLIREIAAILSRHEVTQPEAKASV